MVSQDSYFMRAGASSLSSTRCPVRHEVHAALLSRAAPRFRNSCCLVESNRDRPVESSIDSRPSLSSAVIKGVVDRVRKFLNHGSVVVPNVLRRTHTFDSPSVASFKKSSSCCLISSASFSGCCEITTCIISDTKYLLSSLKNLWWAATRVDSMIFNAWI